MNLALPTAGLVAVLAIGAVAWSRAPASPVSADAPVETFSEVRARPLVDLLAGEIGHRMAGTDGATRALDALAAEMRAIPGLEVEVQEITFFSEGIYSGASLTTVRNLVARLPGKSSDAVLLAAHYDTPPSSVGAADDAVAVAAVVEVARCLAAGPRLPRSVVFLVDEGEELGLFGAKGFMHHPLADDVVAYLNLEAAGARGRPILFQTGPGAAWLADAYAAAPHPHGTVLGQDVFQSGVIPSDTDFRVYRDAGLVGLDVALYRDGWAYHTHLDTPERLQDGSLQEMGDNALAVVRELATRDVLGDAAGPSGVYWDVVGSHLVTYDSDVAALLTIAALIGLAAAIGVVMRRDDVGVRALAGGALTHVIAFVASLAVPAGLAWLLDAVGRGHGWYAHPWIGWPAFGGAAVATYAAVLLPLTRGRRDDEATPAALVAGAAVVFVTLLVAATIAGAGSAYVPLVWTVGAVLALVFVRRPAVAVLAACLVPGVLTAQAGDALLETFAAIAGRLPVTLDVPIALLAVFPIVFFVPVPLALCARDGRFGAGLLVGLSGVLALAGTAALALVPPYTDARPKRLRARMLQDSERALVEVSSMDARPLEWARAPIVDPFEGSELPAVLPAARLEIVESVPVGGSGARDVSVVVRTRGASGVILDLSAGRIRHIAAAGGATWTPEPSDRRLTIIAPPDGLRLDLAIEGEDVLRLPLRSWHVRLPGDVSETLELLPEWTTVDAQAWVSSSVDL